MLIAPSLTLKSDFTFDEKGSSFYGVVQVLVNEPHEYGKTV
jgi:hypothetical protein